MTILLPSILETKESEAFKEKILGELSLDNVTPNDFDWSNYLIATSGDYEYI